LQLLQYVLLLQAVVTVAATHTSAAAAATVAQLLSSCGAGMLLLQAVVTVAAIKTSAAVTPAAIPQVMGLEIPMRDLRLMDPALAAWESFAQILVSTATLQIVSGGQGMLPCCLSAVFGKQQKNAASSRVGRTGVGRSNALCSPLKQTPCLALPLVLILLLVCHGAGA
jgi:hypothetical protein